MFPLETKRKYGFIMTCMKVFFLWILLWPGDAGCPVHKFWPSTASSAVVLIWTYVVIASLKSTLMPQVKPPPLLISYISETSARAFNDKRSCRSYCVVTLLALSLTCFEDDVRYMPFDSFQVKIQIDIEGQIKT